MSKYDGWVVKYSWGQIEPSTFRERKADVVRGWDSSEGTISKSLLWKNMGRRLGHKIVKAKLVEVSDE